MRVAEFFVDGFEEIEALTPIDLLRRAGIEIDMISVFDQKKVTGSHDIEVKIEKNMSDINFLDYDLLIIPGGPGTSNYEKSTEFLENLVKFSKAEDKYIAAICAAPSILAKLGLLKNKNATCFPSVEELLIKGEANLKYDNVVVDEKIITSRGAGTSIDFALMIIELLKGKKDADNIAKNILYKK